MAKLKLYTYRVRGRWGFPFDMLRYDQAFPTSDGAAALSAVTRGENRDFDDSNPNDTGKLRTIEIELNGYTRPTGDRWASFGWYVDESSIRITEVTR